MLFYELWEMFVNWCIFEILGADLEFYFGEGRGKFYQFGDYYS